MSILASRSFCLACLSPGTMHISTQTANYAAGFCIAITIALLFLNAPKRNFSWMPMYGLLLLLHPAWTMSVYRGDCGFEKRFYSGVVSLIFAAMIICTFAW